MAASYNLIETDDLPAIDMNAATNALLVSASVETLGAGALARAKEYQFPGLSGSGAIASGINPMDFAWQMTFEVESIADLTTFESYFYAYMQAGGQYRLLSELGESRTYTRLTFYRRIALEPSGDNWVVTAEARWRWMQPG